MKRFAFRLETLLQHRCKIEEREQTKFTQIRKELQLECDRKQSLIDCQDRTREEMAAIQQSDCSAQELQWCCSYLDHLARQIKNADLRIAEVEKKLEAQKQIMIAAIRDRKIIEKLKMRKQREFQSALDREDQKSIDEMVVTRFTARP